MKRKHTYILDQGKEGFGWISASTGQRKFEFDLNKVRPTTNMAPRRDGS